MQRLVLALLLFMLVAVWGLSAPVSQKELEQASDVIVDAVVGSPVQCLGKIDEHHCWDLYGFTVPLQVLNVIKGSEQITAESLLRTTFLDYDRSSKNQSVGTPWGVILQPGDQGRYYLKKLQETYLPIYSIHTEVAGLERHVHIAPVPKRSHLDVLNAKNPCCRPSLISSMSFDLTNWISDKTCLIDERPISLLKEASRRRVTSA